jgi:hypothetical protein
MVRRLTMFSDVLRADRERNGLTVEQAARRLVELSPQDVNREAEATVSAYNRAEGQLTARLRRSAS